MLGSCCNDKLKLPTDINLCSDLTGTILLYFFYLDHILGCWLLFIFLLLFLNSEICWLKFVFTFLTGSVSGVANSNSYVVDPTERKNNALMALQLLCESSALSPHLKEMLVAK
jgi:hypothetical protein